MWFLAGLSVWCLLMSVASVEGSQSFSPAWPVTAPEKMVLVPAGAFTMGSAEGLGDEIPRHKVTVSSYYIDRCEVSNGQYASFMQATGHRAPSAVDEGSEEYTDWAAGKLLPGREKLPVALVDFKDASAYAQWAGKRLPTEAQWEKAARGGDGRVFPWGSTWDETRCNFITDGPTYVGSFPAGASPYGCLDMAGNVWEWTGSLYERYPGNRQKGNEQYGEGYRVMRGGSWLDHCKYGACCYARSYGDPANRLPALGFRCALSVPEVTAFAGAQLPDGLDQRTGRWVIEALARVLPGWKGNGASVVITEAGEGRYVASVPVTGKPVVLTLRQTPAGVWVAEAAQK
ncbi:MAG: formylglycine-generating enzyme family protein [Armatimonadota bacterium]